MEDNHLFESTHIEANKKNNPWRPVLPYAVFGFLWVLFSDKILAFLVQDSDMYEQIHSYNKWLFILITAILLYVLIRLENRRIYGLNREIQGKSQELMAYAEETTAMDQELKDQLEQLNELTDETLLQKDFLNAVINNSNTAIVIWNLEGQIIECNSFYKNMLGYGDEIIGKNWVELSMPKDGKETFHEIVDAIKKTGLQTNGENQVICKDGSLRNTIWKDVLIVNPVNNEEVIVSFGSDITDERESEQVIYNMAYYDKLTGLPNRVRFDDDIQEYLGQGNPFSLYYVDIDHFKNLNDIHGHHIGDLFLVQFADMLTENFEKLQLYRWGGDEFIVIDSINRGESIVEVANRILEMTQKTWHLEGIEFHPTASIGAVTCTNHKDDVNTIFKNLEIALYKAKENGRSRCEFFEPSFLNEIKLKSNLEKAIDVALSEDGFYLNYQPIYNLTTRTLHRLEILIRFSNVDNLNTHIGEVISVAEQTGQIHRIDNWVIERVMSSMNDWKQHIPELKVAVNISAQTFASLRFIPFLQEMLDTYAVDPSTVEFEITEHTIVQNIETSYEIMEGIKSLGFKIALDDFGTRYSSLNYLSKLPFDVLKVDKSYVDFILNEGNDYIIVKQIISLAKAIGLETVAEGIETAEQEVVLENIGCDFGQGYHYARPTSIERIIKRYSQLEGTE